MAEAHNGHIRQVNWSEIGSKVKEVNGKIWQVLDPMLHIGVVTAPVCNLPLAAKLADDIFREKIQVHLRRGQPIMPENVLQGSGRGVFCQNYFPEYPFTYL